LSEHSFAFPGIVVPARPEINRFAAEPHTLRPGERLKGRKTAEMTTEG